MSRIGIIGGTGLNTLKDFEATGREVVHTPYGEPSGAFTKGTLGGNDVIFLARHGYSHRIPPHMINYRANIWAMKNLGIECIIAFSAVGGISKDMKPGNIVIPHQIVDYTYGRQHTFFAKDLNEVTHIDFSEPYTPSIRKKLIDSANSANIDIIDYGVYAATQGPRLETAAEINRIERDGCDIVGMTGMPEASLARELGLDYAAISIVVNPAAGRSKEEITMDMIREHMGNASAKSIKLLQNFLGI